MPAVGAASVGPVRHCSGDRLGAAVLYALLTLRADVFVVEQQAPYRELDGADLAPDTLHVWFDAPAGAGAADGTAGHDPVLGPVIVGTGRRVVAVARLRATGEGVELGRVAVAEARRGHGLGAAVVGAGCELGGRPLHLNAQRHLEAWYAGFGFVTVGPAFDWEGIAHVPMRLSA